MLITTDRDLSFINVLFPQDRRWLKTKRFSRTYSDHFSEPFIRMNECKFSYWTKLQCAAYSDPRILIIVRQIRRQFGFDNAMIRSFPQPLCPATWPASVEYLCLGRVVDGLGHYGCLVPLSFLCQSPPPLLLLLLLMLQGTVMMMMTMLCRPCARLHSAAGTQTEDKSRLRPSISADDCSS